MNIGVRAFSRIAAASFFGAWGTPHIHLGAWAFSQIHTIGDMGLGDSQTACVLLIGVRAFSRIAAASCLGGMGRSPYTPRGLGILPNTRHRRYGAWGLPNSLRLLTGFGSPNSGSVLSWGHGVLPIYTSGLGQLPNTRHRRYGAWGLPNSLRLSDWVRLPE